MSRWTGSWLGGPASAGLDSDPSAPGVRLGLPPDGPRSVATLARRAGAFAIDALLSALVAAAFTAPAAPRDWSLVVFFVEYVFFTGFFGETPGMRVFHLRVIRLDSGGPLGLVRAVLRTVLLVLLVPALITDRDRRGLHDRLVTAVVVNA